MEFNFFFWEGGGRRKEGKRLRYGCRDILEESDGGVPVYCRQCTRSTTGDDSRGKRKEWENDQQQSTGRLSQGVLES